MSTILTSITQSYQQATSGWYSYLFPVAQHLFGMLAVIEIAWSGILWAIHKSEMESLWTECLKKMLTLGFFYTVLIEAQTWVPDVIQSFMKIGAGASHISALYPSDILDQGVSIAESVMQPLLQAGLLHAGIGLIVGGLTSLIVLICFALIAAELVVSLIESYIVVGAGVLLLGFSASSFTSQYASKYLNYAMSIGIKLFVLYLVIGVGSTLASNWSTLLIQGGIKNMTPFFEIIGGSLVFFYIARNIPNKAESLLSGTFNASGVGLASAATGAAMVTTRSSVSGSQAGFEAVKQATQVAQQHNYSPAGVMKGVAAASSNLFLSAAGSHSGHYRTVGSGMSQRGQQLERKLAENIEQKVANQK